MSPVKSVSKLSRVLPPSLTETAMQGMVRVIIDEDSIEIYRNELNETFP
jgi:hypothetical protein